MFMEVMYEIMIHLESEDLIIIVQIVVLLKDQCLLPPAHDYVWVVWVDANHMVMIESLLSWKHNEVINVNWWFFW